MGMPMSSASGRRYSLAEFERLRDAVPPGPRYEFLDGEVLATPSPNRAHQRIILRLALRLEPFVRAHALGEMVLSPFDVRFGERLVFQPDLLVATPDDVRQRRMDAARELLLAVEILSPGSARHDRLRKRPRYQEQGVAELWLVDVESELVERWTPGDDRPEIVTATLAWRPEGAAEALTIDLPELFEDARR